MVMIAQRPPGSAPCVQATAEALPLRDKCVDAAMAMLTVGAILAGEGVAHRPYVSLVSL
jgi:hypothetical protein